MDIFKVFNLSKYKFLLKAKEDLILPPYKGSTLRGGFGITFRKICCFNKKNGCSDCSLKEKCAYAYIFETSPQKNSQKLRNIREIPRPFIIEPPLETKTNYKKDESLEFNLILIGKAIEYLPYFVFTFKELGNIGLGKNRGKFELDRICDFKKNKVYDKEDDILRNFDSRINFEEIINYYSNLDSLSLNFLTPTRIKIKNDLIVKPEFHILIRALLHRFSALSYFHCQAELKLDYNLLISQAERIRIKEDNLKWLDWERYSSRQNTRMKFGGFVGRITYEGNFKEFLPLLLLGQFTHIGKNCTFGLGKYEILKEG
ncbi:MAG: CRISPR system precrRNA processing endoribonuclease RAMP protein Cas6 [Candidatus Omnitrophica bacterium]|nr:CRISPR system precrRNA processing endoribonuclease RAMP protein Cas6 [Candidatus Omnitrophota bacterium]